MWVWSSLWIQLPIFRGHRGPRNMFIFPIFLLENPAYGSSVQVFQQSSHNGREKSDEVEKKEMKGEMCELKGVDKTAFLFFFFLNGQL